MGLFTNVFAKPTFWQLRARGDRGKFENSHILKAALQAASRIGV
jgi:hypothetical protein